MGERILSLGEKESVSAHPSGSCSERRKGEKPEKLENPTKGALLPRTSSFQLLVLGTGAFGVQQRCPKRMSRPQVHSVRRGAELGGCMG